MERLTRWQNDIVLICKKSCDDCKQAGDTLCSAQENVYKRLAAYEDIGTVEDFQRLVTAQNEGRLVETCTYSQEDSDSTTWDCSNCGCAWNFECDGVLENNVKYCPECGAKVTHITTRYFDEDADDYVDITLTREEAAKALTKEGKGE